MKLHITAIANAGALEKERVVIKVETDTNLDFYALFRAWVRGSKITNRVEGAYWFHTQELKAGDVVVLYTKGGAKSSRVLESGATAYFFYWFQTEPQWSDNAYAPALVHTIEWEPFLNNALAPEPEEVTA